MGVFQGAYTPYTNFHELNADWIVSKVKELEAKYNEDIRENVKNVMKDAFIDIAYNEDNKAITFYIDLKDSPDA